VKHATAFVWNGASMEPKWPRLAAERFEPGETYLLIDVEHYSGKSLRHEFAWLRQAFASLPQNIADEFMDEEHLRKWALIQTGFYHETLIDAGSKSAALRVAAWARSEEQLAAVVTRGPLVVIRKAKSQSRRTMDKAEFQASKQAILEHIAGMIGVTPEALNKQGDHS